MISVNAIKYTTEYDDKFAVIVSHVEKLDTITAPDLKAEIVYLIKNGKRNIIVDLALTRYCDSSGLSALLTGNRLCKEAGGTFVVCTLQPPVEKLVEISQLGSVLNITPTRNEAIDWVMLDEVERDMRNEQGA
jgi:anti-anti-sigma factor